MIRDELLQAFIASTRFGTAEKRLLSIVESGGAKVWVERQLNVSPTTIQYPKFVTDGSITGPIELRKSYQARFTEDYRRRLQFMKASEYPVLDRLAMFWSNHFTISRLNNLHARFVVPYEFEAIRPNLLGKFEDLCFAASTHTGMLLYLANFRSSGPNSLFAKRRPNAGINENQARELLELHTIGRTGPYTQQDVEQLALIMTGWSVESNANTVTKFLPLMHEPGTKTVMGKVYGQPDAHGEMELKLFIRDVSRHRATADFIGLKLCRYMISNRLKPDAAVVKAVSDSFFQSGGDLLTVYRTLFAHPDAWLNQNMSMRNIRLPDDWIVALTRIFDVGDLTATNNPMSLLLERYAKGGSFGQPYGLTQGPDGWPQDTATWTVGEVLFNKGRFALELGSRVSATTMQNEPGFTGASSIVENFLPLRRTDATEAIVDEAESPEQAMSLAVLAPQFERRA